MSSSSERAEKRISVSLDYALAPLILPWAEIGDLAMASATTFFIVATCGVAGFEALAFLIKACV